MISSIKTPGVYIHEINGFPPSIAQVATAIPAFIGYTEKGPTEPTKVTSLLEYEENFGGAPEPAGVNITLNVEYTVTESQFKMYNSLRLFFANGGGECYIVSIGDYETATPFSSADPFNDGLDLLEKVDEVTLLLFPDAVNLGATNLGLVQKHALMQCADLMDRFTVMDVIQTSGPANGLEQDSADFRDQVGNQNLKYGAAYYPYLQTSFGYNFRFNDINGTAAGKVDFATLYASDATITSALSDFATMNTDINDGANGILADWDAAQAANPKVTVAADGDVANYLSNIFGLLATLGDPVADISHTGLETLVTDMITTSLRPVVLKLVQINLAYDGLGGTILDVSGGGVGGDFVNAQWGDFTSNGAAGDYPVTGTNPYTALIEDSGNPGNADLAKTAAQLDKLFSQVTTAMTAAISAVEEYELKVENDLTSMLPVYPSIIAELNKSMNHVPPSGAMVGVYANVDATRGVWKAPGNVSVNGIIGLADDITDKEQENMNIHESGKSINAIRKFTGKGLLVWGVRTLDGNSNDWRYINVRRLANMIEESAKKACMNFVFEPNVKQTWVNIKGMIENYLTTLWSDGALAGAKAEDAFFVSVGLNETMSAQDVLEGRLIVKIGYAPSRPAEFIILEFIQTQQKS
ncbi:phage tail sheath C-terminal domain-containing protein [Aureisphaera galaxeae]|uniref:phage tail sheath C-terminal domain-containing protein n=1 Tax=Aureisphaera galaxeae TaxID=1538023 RepID=UPI0023505B80|nr:phage tail sheath C-terminal domain-containing protein [Aureisphaera galaxeae]MDC8005348.1 phage tail sheath C-terminal domain-containing protein [Aureisphaera galaxeae]